MPAVAIAVLLVLALQRAPVFAVFRWGAVFSFGLVLFLRVSGVWNWRAAFTAWTIVTLASWFVVGTAVTIVALCTTGAIALWTHPGPLLAYLGRVSFSLYLLHIPVGGRVMVLAGRLGISGPALLVWFGLALAASLAAAQLLWWLIECPSQALAQRIRYKTRALPGDDDFCMREARVA